MGKPIAGGVPASIWGITADVAARLAAVRAAVNGSGHSGIGTTLSGSALQLACIRACLEEVMTAENYRHMLTVAERIDSGLQATLERLSLPWHVARIGARMELVASPKPVRNAVESRAAGMPRVEHYLHLALLNRGFLLTPFHNMILVSPATSMADGAALVAALGEVLGELVA